jgi:RNA polymerase sigma factor (sigma-70 family)
MGVKLWQRFLPTSPLALRFLCYLLFNPFRRHRLCRLSACNGKSCGAMIAPMPPSPSEDGPAETTRHGWFATTHWSVVLAAKEGASSEAAIALDKLCRAYWPPLYAYIRRDGHDAIEAQDLTQEFFARLLAKGYLQHLQHQQGKFRSFLLAYLKHFLSEQRRNAGAQKRGGGCVFISLNEPVGENGYLLEPVDELTPDQVFERRWAQAVLQTALSRLREEYAARDQVTLFDLLQDYQPHEPGGRSYAQLGEALAMTESAVKSAVQRMRQRHRELLREAIAHTVTRPEEIEEELRHFRALLG